jgi:integrase
LRWEDVDFEAKEVRIRWQLDENGALRKPKTKAGLRTVPLLPILERTLRDHRKVQLAVGLSSPQHLVFCSAKGSRSIATTCETKASLQRRRGVAFTARASKP